MSSAKNQCIRVQLLSLPSNGNNSILFRSEGKLASSPLLRWVYVNLESHRAPAKVVHTEKRIYCCLILVTLRTIGCSLHLRKISH